MELLIALDKLFILNYTGWESFYKKILKFKVITVNYNTQCIGVLIKTQLFKI